MSNATLSGDVPAASASPGISLEQLRQIPIGFTCAAFLITIFRLYARRKSLGLDDLFATLAFIANLAQTAVLSKMYFEPPVIGPTHGKLVTSYLNVVLFYCIDWFARTAILFSIIRITTAQREKRILHWVAGFFLILLCGNIGLWLGVCEARTWDGWKENPIFPVCAPGKAIPAYQITCGVLADALLVFLPMRTLRRLTSNPPMRRRLMILFAASLFLTIALIIQSVIVYTTQAVVTLVMGLVEQFVAILVCNLPVVVIALMHLLGFSTAPATYISNSKPISGVQVPSSTFPKFTAPRNNRGKSHSRGVYGDTYLTDIHGGSAAVSMDDLSMSGVKITTYTHTEGSMKGDNDLEKAESITGSRGEQTILADRAALVASDSKRANTGFMERMKTLAVDSEI